MRPSGQTFDPVAYVNAGLPLIDPTKYTGGTLTRATAVAGYGGYGVMVTDTTVSRIGMATRALIAADNSATWIVRMRPVYIKGAGNAFSGFGFIESTGDLRLFHVLTSTNTWYLSTDNGASASSSFGITSHQMTELFAKIVVAAGATTATSRNVSVYISGDGINWTQLGSTAAYKPAGFGFGGYNVQGVVHAFAESLV